ncbi:methyl-accepting chemotaxis protein [Ornithinibacillus contaminans]|uniref:methyl-accepting chemotaxis protein n=1 Tax=Ornithinibacillus contaminans TaxID=694055 RepID=UPI00064D81BC|nr:methyl-accepting chemotaxis protein [Ornithinibacillus contaminans]
MKRLVVLKSIRTKIILGFSLILLFVLILGTFNFLTISKMNNDTSDIVSDQVPLVVAEEKLAFNMANRTALLNGYLLYGDKNYRDSFDGGIEESIALENQVIELSGSAEVNDLIDKKIQWGTLTDEVLAAYDEGDKEKAMTIMNNQVKPLADELMEGFEALASKQEELINDKGQEIIDSGNASNMTSLIFAILVVAIGILVAIITATLITKPIKLVMNRMKAIANGELHHTPLETKSMDEVGQLVEATNEMNANMRELLSTINEVSETVSSQSEELTQSANEVKLGAEQIASTMEELATGTETQANSAGDLSSIMGTFSTNVMEANENGEHIANYSKEVLDLTNEGAHLMESSTYQMQQIDQIVLDAVKKVEGLDAHSQKISNLVSVIQEIAEQTNLLALNAAIEAARAGEHGKGFAVVADEVRKLAEQVSDSVSDITGIVGNIQNESSSVSESLQNGYKEVEQGTVQIETTGQTFKKISDAVSNMVTSITTVTTNLTTMAANSQEMSSSIEEIAAISEESAAGVEQTSASAQQVSGSMEEFAGSSDQLAKLAEELNLQIGKFKL